MSSVLDQVLSASKPDDLFGGKDADGAKAIYRRLLKQVHPDKFEDRHRARATEASANLTRLYTELVNPTVKPFVITTKRGTHEVGTLLAKGDVANVYRATSEGKPSVVKIARSPKNADLIAREVTALKKIKDEVHPELTAFYPQVLDTFKHRDAQTRIDRRGVVTDQHVHGFVPLHEVRAKFPAGLDPRDAAWMFRRILIALSGLHRIGIVHGGIVPPHLLMELDKHGLVLVDYTASCIEEDAVVPFLAKGWDWVYPNEVSAKVTPTPETDIYMAAKVLEYMMGDQAPRQMRAFVKGCTIGTQKSRPGDALSLLEEFTELIERLYGPRKFRVFRLPD